MRVLLAQAKSSIDSQGQISMFKRCEERGQGEYDEILSLFFSNDDLRKENLLTSPCFCYAIIRFLCLGMPKNKYIELNCCVCQRSGYVQTQ